MKIKRDSFLNKLISLRHNGLIKVVSGVKRCGKSYLLFDLFYNWLLEDGVKEDHIIKIDLEDLRNEPLRDPKILLDYIDDKIKFGDMHYIMIDEIQLVDRFEEVLNSYLKIKNVDVYVTGSNARFLSKDIVTTFRGRSYEVNLRPLSFSEFFSVYEGSKESALDEYMTFGGLPQVVQLQTDQLKSEYLKALFEQTYIKDIKQRNKIRNDSVIQELLDIISSSVGSLTNPTKLSNTFESVKHVSVSRNTIVDYLDYISDAFLVDKVLRYDLKGKRYVERLYKYYMVDCGLRNARLNFRQIEPTHLMENIIYNELRYRGYNVDVGIVPAVVLNSDGSQKRISYEIDFVCNQGSKRYYIQSAYRMTNQEKVQQEQRSLINIPDSFKKIIIVYDDIHPRRDDNGITTISIYDFLLKPNSLDI